MTSFRSLAACGLRTIPVWVVCAYSTSLRKSILDLYEAFLNSSTSWGKENAFNRWCVKQPWRALMPISFFSKLARFRGLNVTSCANLILFKLSSKHFQTPSKVWHSSAMKYLQPFYLYFLFSWDRFKTLTNKLSCSSSQRSRGTSERGLHSSWQTWMGQTVLHATSRHRPFHVPIPRCVSSYLDWCSGRSGKVLGLQFGLGVITGYWSRRTLACS